MGRCKEHPRYNVLSFRCSDEERAAIESALGPNEHIGDMLRKSAIAYARLSINRMEQTCS